MRRIRIAAATVMVAAGLIGAVAAPASASFDHHFRVFEKASFNPTPNEEAFRFKGKLFDPRNRHNRVGRDHGLCKVRPHNALKCRGTYHLNGEIGGFGNIKVRGNIRPDDNRLNVVGGSGDFNGVAGKVVFRFLNRRGTKSIDKFDLVR
jgi:hypothetical protein